MKTITKLILINDGIQKAFHNNDRLYVETSPRAEKILSAFLTDGWTLHSRVPRVAPAGRDSEFGFYIDGWDFLFTKTVPDDEPDHSDRLLSEAVAEAVRQNGTGADGGRELSAKAGLTDVPEEDDDGPDLTGLSEEDDDDMEDEDDPE